MEPIIVTIMAWIAMHSDLPVPNTLPSIDYAPMEEIQEVQGNTVGQYIAYYDHYSNIIYLPVDWVVTDLADYTALVHELVHVMQAEANITYSCPNEAERQAYDLQEEFAQELGHTIYGELFNLNELFVRLISVCALD